MAKEQTMTFDEMQTAIAKMLQDAKAEAAKIVADAKASAGEANGCRMTPEEREKYEAYMNELVEIKLFKDNHRYKDDVFVGVNGENVLIQRGVPVKVKRKFAEVLAETERRDLETARMIDEKSAEWAAASATL